MNFHFQSQIQLHYIAFLCEGMKLSIVHWQGRFTSAIFSSLFIYFIRVRKFYVTL